MGCGVTAIDEADALSLIQQRVFGGRALPPIAQVIADVDVRQLDQGHVAVNMEPPKRRGIWFPMAYQ